jgi:hypothetical protein
MGKFLGPIVCQEMNRLAGILKGAVDFYYWKGIPCWRAWPHGAENVLSLPRAMSAAAFAEVARRKGRMPQLLRAQFELLAGGSTDTWGDVFTRWNMFYYKEKGELMPEVVDFQLIYGSGLKEIIITLAPLAGPVGSLFAGALSIRNNPDGHKTYRGTQVKCTPKTVAMLYPRRGFTVKAQSVSPYQMVYGDGNSKKVSFAGDYFLDPYYANKCLAAWAGTPEYFSSLGRSQVSSRTCTRFGHSGMSYKGSIWAERQRMWFTPALPSGWTIDDVNGMRWYYVTPPTLWNKTRLVRFESSLGSRMLYCFPGYDKSLTVPFYPTTLAPVYSYGIPYEYPAPAIWDIAENDLECISDPPYTQFQVCRLTKGKRNEFNYVFKTPVVGNIGVTYVPVSGAEFFMVPVIQDKEIPWHVMTPAEEVEVDSPEGSFNAEQERSNAFIWNVNMNKYGPTTYDSNLIYNKDNFPELYPP